MDLELSGKVALVTGGSRGIGRATALTRAREGCGVAICARGRDTLEATMAELRAVSSDVWGVTADVTNASDVDRFVSGAAGAMGRIDIVVCNVGESFGGSSLEASDEDWMKTLDTNLLHSVRTIRAALPHMNEGGAEALPSSPQYPGGSRGRVRNTAQQRPQRYSWRRRCRGSWRRTESGSTPCVPAQSCSIWAAGTCISRTTPIASPRSWRETCRRDAWARIRRSRTL